MFMRFLGGGIGHIATDDLQQRTSMCGRDEGPDPHDEDILDNTQDHTQGEDDDVDGDPDKLEADEEIDYGYADDFESERVDSEGENSEGEEETRPDTDEDDEVL